MTFRFLFVLLLLALGSQSMADSTEVQYLSGVDKDNTVAWQFHVSGGRNGGVWSTIPVPSNWETQGFGTYRYWSDWAGEPAPDKEGLYRHTFSVPQAWQGRAISIVFGGVMTDAEVHINGVPAGPVHQGGMYEFRYEISDLLRYGEDNQLEVRVTRYSSNKSINLAERRADFWVLSGIYRPVWLEAKPSQHIERVALNARHTGEFNAEVQFGGVATADKVVVRVMDLAGKSVGRSVTVDVAPEQQHVNVSARFSDVIPWSAEQPQRYKASVELKRGRKTLHRVEEVFGFRSVEVRPRDGLYVNGTKVRLKGVNRHSFWPDSGRTTSATVSRKDVELIKSMNMNAVRVAHAPPDKHFLEMADELGLYVINELTGWQDAYDTEAGRPLVKEMILRDHNHPSIIIWANGNEGGWNRELDADYGRWDLQQRPVIHPWDFFGGIDTSHYESLDCCVDSLFGGSELFMPTEFLHALYDGGAGAGLDDWWNKMLRSPLAVGGFIWSFADEGLVRDDQSGAIDTAGNSAADGILGPYREKEGSYYAVREIWSPIYLPLSETSQLVESFDGVLRVENRYDETSLNAVNFSWELWDFAGPAKSGAGHAVRHKGRVTSPDIAPGQPGKIALNLPKTWRDNDALVLSATDQHGRLINTWSWMITTPYNVAQRSVSKDGPGAVDVNEQSAYYELRSGELALRIDKKTGRLASVKRGDKQVSLTNGPRLVSGTEQLAKISLGWNGKTPVVRAEYEGNLRHVEWRLHSSGWLQMNYAYQFPGMHRENYLGVTFDYPEEEVLGMHWLGRGPYRVWKNRLKGVTFDVWHNDYNDTVTGQSWDYPEFKGFYRNVNWAVLETRELPITMVTSSENTYFRIFTPREAAAPMASHVEFPAGDISFLQGIAPMGTKFYPAAEHGPQGGPNRVARLGRWVQDEMYFYFGDLSAATDDNHAKEGQ